MRRNKHQRGLSLLDLLICMASLCIVAGILIGAGRQIRFQANTTICMNNLRQISLAMASYYNDYGDYPRGLPYNTIQNQLNDYILNTRVFICPEDMQEEYDSYSQFYVYRGDDMSGYKYVMGCPRHKRNKLSASNFSLKSTYKGTVIPVSANDIIIKPGTIARGNIELEDGTTITGDVDMLLTQSIKLDNGVLYTVVRVLDGESGTVSVNATHGTKLEIVTPSVIAGVRGTAFTIEVGYLNDRPFSTVTVSQGEVAVTPLAGLRMDNGHLVGAGKRTIPLNAGTSMEIHGNTPSINKSDLTDFLNDLNTKIQKGIHEGRNMDTEKDLYKWLSDSTGIETSNDDGTADSNEPETTTYAGMTDANGFTSELTVTVDGENTTISITMSSSPDTPKDLGHMVIELPFEAWGKAWSSAESSGDFPAFPGYDPTTYVSGMIFIASNALHGGMSEECSVQFTIDTEDYNNMSEVSISTRADGKIGSVNITLDHSGE